MAEWTEATAAWIEEQKAASPGVAGVLANYARAERLRDARDNKARAERLARPRSSGGDDPADADGGPAAGVDPREVPALGGARGARERPRGTRRMSAREEATQERAVRAEQRHAQLDRSWRRPGSGRVGV